MSDSTPNRTISGLAPVARMRPSAAALVKANRTPPASTTDRSAQRPVTADADQAEASQPEQGAPEMGVEATRSPRPKGVAGKRSPSAGKVPMGVDVPEDTRDRARGAFRAAAYFEGVATFGEFVTNALEAEIRRVELTHNSGQPIEPLRENLPAGRRGR